MGLVDYSDSDASDVEETKPTKPISNSSKPAFQKVVDRSNPGKIKVSLPQSFSKTDASSDGPPSKRIKTSGGGGAFSGFNSFLPAPKRAGQPSNATLGGGAAGKKSGLGVGVNLKTGAAPGFSREPEKEYEYEGDSSQAPTSYGDGINLPAPKASQPDDQIPAEEVKLVGKPLMFRPLSVARKPAKKKTASQLAAAAVAQVLPKPSPAPVPQTPAEKAPRPKVSLFSMSAEDSSSFSTPATGEYEPMIHESQSQTTSGDSSQSSTLEPYSIEEYTPNPSQTLPPFVPTPPVSQSLDDIAGDLQLSAAERRQLFGRQKGKQTATKIINFNTDEEYLHNEELRASGEQVKHNPVRSIAPGKHSLKQLVNAAQSQKEAHEESFQSGKNNRKEASSRYGW